MYRIVEFHGLYLEIRSSIVFVNILLRIVCDMLQ